VRLGAPNHLLERALDGPGVGSLAADADGFLEQMLIKHNIRAFHVYRVALDRLATESAGVGRCVRPG